MSNGSGDFVIAFSTGSRVADRPPAATTKIERLENARTSPLFLAVVESVEEAVYNSLTPDNLTYSVFFCGFWEFLPGPMRLVDVRSF
jgi:L-aminopeptidase/D-esterase-like protein